jgi:hypothetical protein
MRLFSIRRLVAVAGVFALAGGGGVALAQHARGQTGGWAWYQGTDTGYVGEQADTHALVVYAARDLNLRASHVRMMSDDGEFDFTHPNAAPTANLNAFFLGTSTRTPIQIGDQESNTGLIVAGEAGQRSDLERWTLSNKTVAAVDGKGRLRLGTVTLEPVVVRGRVMLYAVVGSSKQLLAQGRMP